jgi:hypothetical protein
MCSLPQAFPICDDQIRIVDILPGSGSDPIALQCRVINLQGDHVFEALSYVWGDVHYKITVNISGYSINITEFLYAAFQQLRHPQNRRALWADQVCINQDDERERSHQVGLMRAIYERCSQCLIWLGTIPRDRQFFIQDAVVALDFLDTVARTRHGRHPFVADNEDGERARKAFRALVMGGNPWWSRVWTLQEASLPISATLQWGPLAIPLETVELAAEAMCSHWSYGAISDRVAAEMSDLISNFLYPVRGLSIARRGESPLHTLMRWRYREATDPRDKVYGFIGLFNPDTLHRLPSLRDVSYTVSPATLFRRVTVELIQFNQDLRPLIGARELPHVTPGLPTWAIDFASCSAIGRRQTMWWQHSHRYLRWTASKSLKHQFETARDDKSLRLCGVFIDNVQQISRVYHLGVEDDVNDDKLRDFIFDFYRDLEQYQISRCSDMNADYIGGGTLKDAFWRTMLGNLIMGEMPKGVPKDYDVSDFEEYVNDGRKNRLTLSLHGLLPNHAFFITAKGYIGIGPRDMRENDTIYVFYGGRVPFVIRAEDTPVREGRSTENCRYQLVGDAYVHGIMRGEGVMATNEQPRIIELV